MSGTSSRQNQMVADEMFPDGPGPLDFVDVEDGVGVSFPRLPPAPIPQVRDGVSGPAGLLSELTASEKTVSGRKSLREEGRVGE